MPNENAPHMQNIWTVSVELGNRKFEEAMSKLAEKIMKKQDECHELGMLATIHSISHDVSNIYGQGTVISAIMTVSVTPLAVSTTGTGNHLLETLPESHN